MTPPPQKKPHQHPSPPPPRDPPVQILKCPYKSRPEENKEKEHLHYTNTVDSWAVRARACATGAED